MAPQPSASGNKRKSRTGGADESKDGSHESDDADESDHLKPVCWGVDGERVALSDWTIVVVEVEDPSSIGASSMWPTNSDDGNGAKEKGSQVVDLEGVEVGQVKKEDGSKEGGSKEGGSKDGGSKEDAEELDELFDDIVTYRVHRAVLATGKRSSKYFAKLFTKVERSKEATSNAALSDEAKARTTKLKLTPSAAKAFPCLLDFVYWNIGSLYGPDGNILVTFEEAVALHHVADYLGMPALAREVEMLVRDEAPPARLSSLLAEATTYQDEKLIAVIHGVAARCWRQVLVSGKDKKGPTSASAYLDLLDPVGKASLLQKALDLARNDVVRMLRDNPHQVDPSAEHVKHRTKWTR